MAFVLQASGLTIYGCWTPRATNGRSRRLVARKKQKTVRFWSSMTHSLLFSEPRTVTIRCTPSVFYVRGFFVEITLSVKHIVYIYVRSLVLTMGLRQCRKSGKRFVTLSPNIIHRNGHFQKNMEGVPRLAGISFWKPNWKLSGSVWGIRRTRFQPARFQRCARELECCNQSSVDNPMRLTLQHNKDRRRYMV